MLYRPKDFKSVLERNPLLLNTLGKKEFEEIAKEIITDSIKKGAWVQKEIMPVATAERMAEAGHLIRIKKPEGYTGIYEISPSALGYLMNNYKNKNGTIAVRRLYNNHGKPLFRCDSFAGSSLNNKRNKTLLKILLEGSNKVKMLDGTVYQKLNDKTKEVFGVIPNTRAAREISYKVGCK